MGKYGLLMRCLLVSGQRLNQIASLDSAFVEPGERQITWPGHLMKNNQEFILPYGDLLHKLSSVHWVRPEVVVEVTYLTWTEDNLLRQVSYQGQREDKPASQVVRAVPQPPRKAPVG
jgi:ATP-dependent DNA ligase